MMQWIDLLKVTRSPMFAPIRLEFRLQRQFTPRPGRRLRKCTLRRIYRRRRRERARYTSDYTMVYRAIIWGRRDGS
jgi:hypothetical protein